LNGNEIDFTKKSKSDKSNEKRVILRRISANKVSDEYESIARNEETKGLKEEWQLSSCLTEKVGQNGTKETIKVHLILKLK
jgi:hypothetical protein